MKISLGEKKGFNIKVPNSIEPTKNVVTLAIFSMLRKTVKGAKCLDLFAGSGNLGLNALSLGARECVFVDQESNNINTIKENALKLGFENKAKIIHAKAEKLLASPPNTIYDIIFLDPPYNQTIDNLARNLLNCINEDSVIIYLHHKNVTVNLEGFKTFRQRVYGKTAASLINLDA